MKAEYLNNKMFESIIDRFQRSKRSASKYRMMMDDLHGAMQRKKNRKLCVEREKILLNNHQELYDVILQEFSESENLLAQAFYTLSENLVRFAKFNLIDSDDALQEGVVICFEKIDRFNSDRGKAFNYFTTCVLNHFRQLYRSARNYNELKKKYHEFLNFCENRIIIKNGREIAIYNAVN